MNFVTKHGNHERCGIGHEVGCLPQLRRLMTAFRVQPHFVTMPDMRALNEMTRFANFSSCAFHLLHDFALSAASAGSLRRVLSKLASRAIEFFDHARMADGLMFTDLLNFEHRLIVALPSRRAAPPWCCSPTATKT